MSPEDAIAEAARRGAEKFRSASNIPFGSHARGSDRAGSGISLLVLVDPSDGLSELAGQMHREMVGLGVPIDIITMPMAHFESRKDIVGTVARPAAREGRVLYQRVA